MLGLRTRWLGWLGALALAASGCGRTVDSLGHDEMAESPGGGSGMGAVSGSGGSGGGSAGGGSGGLSLAPLVGPDTYPNAFVDDLDKKETEVEDRIAAVYQQLFHGGTTQVIFYEGEPGEAYIRDVLHMDIRTEGIGLGMLIAVQRNEQEDFEKLYLYAKNQLAATGAAAGYFKSKCDTPTGKIDCYDPYGMQQITMALVFAHGRWQATGSIDYEAEALALLDVMLHKQEQNGGTPDDVTNMFSDAAKLTFDVPDVAAASFTRPSIEMPAYYELWSRATGDPFWAAAATAARTYLGKAANDVTGLTPVRAHLNGDPKADSRSFQPEAYRTHLNLALDWIWSGQTEPDSVAVDTCNLLISFFAGEGITSYGATYEIDGTPLDPAREPALIAVNGVAALPSDHADRVAFIKAVWDMKTVTGEPRYYSGLLHLLALMTLGGQMRVY